MRNERSVTGEFQENAKSEAMTNAHCCAPFRTAGYIDIKVINLLINKLRGLPCHLWIHDAPRDRAGPKRRLAGRILHPKYHKTVIWNRQFRAGRGLFITVLSM